MKRWYVLLVALVALAFSPEAAAQTTTWTGTGDADPIVALGWEETEPTVTATGSGYEFMVPAFSTSGAGGATGLTGIAAQDFEFTVDFGTDLVVAMAEGYVLAGIWAGTVTSVDGFWDSGPIQVWTENPNDATGEYLVYAGWGDEDVDIGEADVTTVAGNMSFRMSRTGNDITAEYTEPGSTSFVTLGTETLTGDMATAAMDFGVIMMAYGGSGYSDPITILIETVTLTTEGVEPEAAIVFISGPHLAEEGQEVTLVANVVGGEGTDCSWTKDGSPAGADGELDLGAVTGADEGTYVVTCTVDEDEMSSEEHELTIVDAVPLAGGLGLGLLAGACALAGAVTIRRKK